MIAKKTKWLHRQDELHLVDHLHNEMKCMYVQRDILFSHEKMSEWLNRKGGWIDAFVAGSIDRWIGHWCMPLRPTCRPISALISSVVNALYFVLTRTVSVYHP